MIQQVTDDDLLKKSTTVNEGPIFGIVGIMNIFGQNYLCVIKEALDIGMIYGAHIYKVTSTKILPYYSSSDYQHVGQYIEELKKYLSEGFYFSFGYDLTSSRQRRIKFLSEKNKDPLRIIASDHRYFWNINLYNSFKEQNIDYRWYTPLIQGYVGIVSGKIEQKNILLGLISRRTHLRAGTRYNARGIDDKGDVANYVETEQIVKMDSIIYSYVILRGSVPIFWEQKGMAEGVVLTRDPETTKAAFNKHFEELINTYGNIFIVDLLSDTKKREIILTKEYVRQVYESNLKDKIKFLHFDFHHYCAGDKYKSLKVLMGKVSQGLQDFGFFIEDTEARKIRSFQKGAFRVNCLDSLDRTNVAQSMIAFMVLQKILVKLGFNMEQAFGQDVVKEGIAFAQIKKPLIQRYKHFWAEQGDNISQQYAGTSSTISKVSRDGKEGFVGKINHKFKNVQRYFINTFSENFQQNSIDIILGKHAKSVITSELNNYLKQELQNKEDLFTEVKNIKLYVGSWNLGGVKTYEHIDLSSWLLPFKDHFIPDIVVIGFQEIVKLNTKSVFMGQNNTNTLKQWSDLVLKNLKDSSGEEYVQVVSDDLVGLQIGLYAKKGINQELSNIATSKVKLGFSGKMGNKGATLIRFFYQDTSFCFINCHLDSGFTIIDAKRRVEQLKEIFQTGFIKDRGTSQSSYQVANHDVQVVLGDLNFRLTLDKQSCHRLIQFQDYEELFKYDEFKAAQQDYKMMQEFKEGTIIFDPTYKYNFNSNSYDAQRVPAWTDRIMQKTHNTNLTQVYYGRSEIRLSDHRPIFKLYEAKIRKINEQVKQEIQEKLILKYKTLNPIKKEQNNLQKRKSTFKRQQSCEGRLVEPNIGDFGLIEANDGGQQSPRAISQSLVITNPLELENIVRSNSVCMKDEELKYYEEDFYPQVLNYQDIAQDNNEEEKNNLNTDENIVNDSPSPNRKQVIQQKEKAADVIKQVGIFNNDSEEENDEGEKLTISNNYQQPQETNKNDLFKEEEEEQQETIKHNQVVNQQHSQQQQQQNQDEQQNQPVQNNNEQQENQQNAQYE